MEQEIISELLNKYGLEAYDNTVDALIKIISLGFDATWLRNCVIIKEFDVQFKTDKKIMRIYTDLGIKYKTHSDHIRRIVSNRKLYEI